MASNRAFVLMADRWLYMFDNISLHHRNLPHYWENRTQLARQWTPSFEANPNNSAAAGWFVGIQQQAFSQLAKATTSELFLALAG